MTDQPQGQQPPPIYQPAAYNPYAGYKPPPPYNTYAILALIFAVVVLPPLGIYFGQMAKKQIAQTNVMTVKVSPAKKRKVSAKGPARGRARAARASRPPKRRRSS